MHIGRLSTTPANFDVFIEECAKGMARLYGAKAAESYAARAGLAVRTAAAHPSVDALGAFEGGTCIGMLMAILPESEDGSEQTGRISFIHVLDRHLGKGVEARLVAESVRTLRAGGVAGIVSECLPLCALELDDAFVPLGFGKLRRMLMSAPLDIRSLSRNSARQSETLDAPDVPHVAKILVEAYEEHPDRLIHPDLHSEEDAAMFLMKAQDGNFGATRPEFLRTISINNRIAGAILGCEAASDMAFILQVVVAPKHQRQGIGAKLICEAAQCFRKAGYKSVSLGVTIANPAKRLYERLGFEAMQKIDAYHWWRPGA